MLSERINEGGGEINVNKAIAATSSELQLVIRQELLVMIKYQDLGW